MRADHFHPTKGQQAVIDENGNAYVRACPGAGKTRTMVALAERAASTMGTRRGVAFLSFTNAACDELRERLLQCSLAGLARAPSYVGTFDAFLLRFVLGPDGTKWARGQPMRFLETWGALGKDGTFGFKNQGGRFIGVPLDAFVPDGQGGVVLQAQRVANFGMRVLLQQLDAAQQASLRRRAFVELSRLLSLGFVTSPFLRLDAVDRLGRQPATTLAHVSARFGLVIVDEAQDCDPVDIRIVQALLSAGCRCVVVADPEQGIFRWRGADPSQLARLTLPELSLSDNFRSTASICMAAGTLRARADAPDRAVGDVANLDIPCLVLAYAKAALADVGPRFVQLAAQRALRPTEVVALAHREGDALAAFGCTVGKNSESRAAQLMRVVCASDVDVRARKHALDFIEDVLERALGEPEDAAVWRWVRTTARQSLGDLIARAPSAVDVCKTMREVLTALRPPATAPFIKKPATVFGCHDTNAPVGGARPESAPIRVSTVHAAKGREFDGVLVVVPNDSRTAELLDAWEKRDPDHEGRAVLYVAATRAAKLLAFAVPEEHAGRVQRLLSRQGAKVDVVRVEGPPCSDKTTARRRGTPRERGARRAQAPVPGDA